MQQKLMGSGNALHFVFPVIVISVYLEALSTLLYVYQGYIINFTSCFF